MFALALAVIAAFPVLSQFGLLQAEDNQTPTKIIPITATSDFEKSSRCGGSDSNVPCLPSENPDGPKCDPADINCEIAVPITGISRTSAETHNELAATFLGGVSLLSRQWIGVNNIISTEPVELTQLGGGAIYSASSGNARPVVDDYLKSSLAENITTDTGSVDMNRINQDRVSEEALRKLTPGLFPLGYQYELSPGVKESRKDTLDTIEDYLGTELTYQLFEPSIQYMVKPLAYGSNGNVDIMYPNDLNNPIFTDAMMRKLRPHPIAYSCEDDNSNTCTRLQDIPAFVSHETAVLSTTKQDTMIYDDYGVGAFMNMVDDLFSWNKAYTKFTSTIGGCSNRGGHLPSAGQLAILSHFQTWNDQPHLSGDIMLTNGELTTLAMTYDGNRYVKSIPIKNGVQEPSRASCIFD